MTAIAEVLKGRRNSIPLTLVLTITHKNRPSPSNKIVILTQRLQSNVTTKAFSTYTPHLAQSHGT